jgi:L-2,4-diaminobutyrate decarboxylase
VIASQGAHLSIRKAAHLLGLRHAALPVDHRGALLAAALPDDLSRSALVLTAGTTSAGAIDPLALAGRAAWTHVDAAWAGPLRLSSHAQRLDGIERADSVAVSAHKWLFQPKESALVLFRDTPAAHAAVSFEGAYLAVPNVGLQGSHGAVAVPLLATLLAWGREGVAARIERCMQLARELADCVAGDPRLLLLGAPETGIVVWRPRQSAIFDAVAQRLPPAAASTTTLGGERWFRNVAANPDADLQLLAAGIRAALDGAA